MSAFTPAPRNYRVLPISIDLHRDENVVYSDIKQLVTTMLSLPPSDISYLSVRPLTGGITNRLYLVENSNQPQLDVIVRFFGEGTGEFIDRTAENMVFSELSDHKFGPRFEGLFDNGRVEGYINARCMSPEEMSQPNVYHTVATLVQKLHSIHLPGFFSYQKGWSSGNDEEEWKRIAKQTDGHLVEPWIWKKIHLFFHMAGEIIGTLEASGDPKNAQRLQKYRELNLQQMFEESKWLKHSIEKILSLVGYHMHIHDHIHGLKAPDGKHDCVSMRDRGMAYALEEVLCHNDLLSGNLLISKSEIDQSLDIRMIDYEYAAYNYRGYDLANHFCEFAGFDFNVENYPSSAVRRDFIKSYLAQSRVKDDFDEEFIDGVENMVELMTLMSCLFWGTWAVVQSGKDLGIDFDYLGYAKRRYDGYMYFKEAFDLV